MNFNTIRKLDTGLGGGGGDWIHRIALFPRSAVFPGRLGLEVEDAGSLCGSRPLRFSS